MATTVDGLLITGGPVNFIYAATLGGRSATLIETQASVAPQLKYKNQGWYAAGSVWETWVTVNAPSTTPPSGHTLTAISFVLFEDTAAQ